MGEGDSSSGDDEDSDSDSDSDTGSDPDSDLDPGGNGIRIGSPAFVDQCADSCHDELRSAIRNDAIVKTISLLVVSDIPIPSLEGVRTIGARQFLGSSPRGSFVVNVSRDYRYMKMGYYVSLHADLLGNPVIPKCSDALDVYRAPILLLRSLKAGIPVSPYLVTDSVEDVISQFDLPILIFPVTPFPSYGYRIVNSELALRGIMRRLTMNRRYTVCVQPLFGQPLAYKSIFGVPVDPETNNTCDRAVAEISSKIYDEFGVPLFKFYVQREGDRTCLCGLDPLENSRKLSPVVSSLIREGVLEEVNRHVQ